MLEDDVACAGVSVVEVGSGEVVSAIVVVKVLFRYEREIEKGAGKVALLEASLRACKPRVESILKEFSGVESILDRSGELGKRPW